MAVVVGAVVLAVLVDIDVHVDDAVAVDGEEGGIVGEGEDAAAEALGLHPESVGPAVATRCPCVAGGQFVLAVPPVFSDEEVGLERLGIDAIREVAQGDEIACVPAIVEMELDGKIQTSDKNGILTFENIVPNVYSSKITHLPDDYEAKDMLYLVEISNNSYLHHKTITLKYTGEELSGEGISDASETSQALVSEDEEEQTVEQPSFDNDNSEFALVFIGAMLIFTSVSLVLSRRKTRGGSKPVSLCPKRSYSNQQNENGENDEKDQ